MNIRLVALAFGTLLAVVLAGCGTKEKPVAPARDRASAEGSPERSASAEPSAPAPETDQPSAAAMSLQGLIQGLPNDRQPKPGPEGGIERDQATEWLARNVVGKSVDFSLLVKSMEAEADGEGKYYADPEFLTDRESGETRKLSTNVKIGRISVGGVPCDVLAWGPSPLWSGLDANTAKQRRDQLKGRHVRFRAKVEEAKFEQGDDEKHLLMIIGLADVVVSNVGPAIDGKQPGPDIADRDKPRPPDDSGTPAAPQGVDVVTAVHAPLKAIEKRKPMHARDLAPFEPTGEVRDEVVEADQIMPRRRVIVGLKDGKPHGEGRAYAPGKRLIVADRGSERLVFYPSGTQLAYYPFVNGKLHGIAYTWWENGNLADAIAWKDGLQHGPHIVFFANGVPNTTSMFVHGKAEGLRGYFHTDGKLYGVTRWTNGVQGDIQILDEETNRNAEYAATQRSKVSFYAKDHWTPRALEQLKYRPPAGAAAKTGEWVRLFDGKSLAGWWPSTMSTRYRDAWFKWEVVNGILTGTGKRQTGWLITDEQYRNFHLRLEARIDAKGNSGVHFGIPFIHRFDYNLDKGYGVEIALADPPPTEASRAFPEPSVRTGGVRPVVRGVRNTDQIHHQPDEWFTMEVVVRGQKITVSVNGKPTAEATITERTRPIEAGHIGLQLHYSTHKVEFRKVEILRLPD
jgi:hypothetical protein